MKPTPINKEIVLDPKRYIVSETDEQGKITFCNDYFVEISGYSRDELLGHSHNIIRHPDMPKVVFKLLWETISHRKNINAVIKNLAKDGRYYWVFTEFESRSDTDTGKIIGYSAARKTISKHVIEIISGLYAKLLEIEKEKGVDASEEYLSSYLKNKDENINFQNFMENIHKFY
ncbi:PAS domain-containing protein [Sulfurimonas sp.]|jgi:PAS domain S-box-containing protein|uniref:PAS domain-containing protein n=1 Tax=Sulfurimonas sp. TaxID=2022749 RepID=UPI0025FAFFEF|nr:PAS domain-containing protein [Sulfurimonas sp.]MCK9473059.1 PAS domain-containing protein [Sulfurimonas sp.]MDD3506579.1 PAS domain-containing protein [Sulfurimonas sp.]